MDLQLVGKRALVTVSTAGIGKAIATSLAKEGPLALRLERVVERTSDPWRVEIAGAGYEMDKHKSARLYQQH